MVPIKLKYDASFLEPEMRGDFMVEKRRKELWLVQLDLLNEFDRVCKKHQLRYFLDGGTLLGAIRHKGFIPWDNDVDIIMLRDDYQKLVQIASQEFKSPYFFQSLDTDSCYPEPIPKLRRSDTCAIITSKYDTHSKQDNGVFIDIFILDGQPEVQEDSEALRQQFDKFFYVFLAMVYEKKKNPIRNLLRTIRQKYYLMRYKSQAKYFKKMEKAAQQYSDSPLIREILFYNYMVIHKRAWYEKAVYVPFEFLSLPVPAEYALVLENIYGKDYMTPKRGLSQHGDLIVDTSRSYKDVIRDIDAGKIKMEDLLL